MPVNAIDVPRSYETREFAVKLAIWPELYSSHLNNLLLEPVRPLLWRNWRELKVDDDIAGIPAINRGAIHDGSIRKVVLP